MRRGHLLVAFFSIILIMGPVSASAEFPVNGTFVSLESRIPERYDQFDGEVVLVEAFATWCQPCLQEMYEFSLLQDEFGNNLTIFSLSVSPGTDSLDKIQQFKQKAESTFDFTASWEFGLDHNSEFATQLNISVIPTSLLIANGSVVQKWEGVTSGSDIAQYIDANVTFPEVSQSDILLTQIMNNGIFRLFSVMVVLLVVYRVVIPKGEVSPESSN